MEIDLDRLPDEPALLQQMLRDVVTAAAYQQGELHTENDKLRMLIKRLLRHRFGRRSEQLAADQLQFGLEDLEQTVAVNQAGQDAADAAAGRQVAVMVQFEPAARIVHRRGRSRVTASRATENAYRRSQLAFYEKHHRAWAPVLKTYLRLTGKI